MVVKDANINIQPVLTKEQMTYNEALKNVRRAAAALQISEEGVDMSNVSNEQLETAIKLIGEMDAINMGFNAEVQKIQQDASSRIRTFQDSANKKFGDVSGRYKELINSMSKVGNTDQGKYSEQTLSTNMSKEKEEELKMMLAQELANARKQKAEESNT